jgi:hypothetical protein
MTKLPILSGLNPRRPIKRDSSALLLTLQQIRVTTEAMEALVGGDIAPLEQHGPAWPGAKLARARVSLEFISSLLTDQAACLRLIARQLPPVGQDADAN